MNRQAEAVVILAGPVTLDQAAATLSTELAGSPEATVQLEEDHVAVRWESPEFNVRLEPWSGPEYTNFVGQVIAENAGAEYLQTLADSPAGLALVADADIDDSGDAILFTAQACNGGFDGEVYDPRLDDFPFREEARSLDELLDAARDSDPFERECAAANCTRASCAWTSLSRPSSSAAHSRSKGSESRAASSNSSNERASSRKGKSSNRGS